MTDTNTPTPWAMIAKAITAYRANRQTTYTPRNIIDRAISPKFKDPADCRARYESQQRVTA